MSSDNWCSPAEVTVPLAKFYKRRRGPGLDPCSNPNSIVGAARTYTCGALYLPWDDLELYENPPYSDLLRFTKKAVQEILIGIRGKDKELVRLVPVATSTTWWETALRGTSPGQRRARRPMLAYTKRIPFLDDFGRKQTTARFDSVLMVYASKRREEEFCDLFAPIIKTVVHADHHTFYENEAA